MGIEGKPSPEGYVITGAVTVYLHIVTATNSGTVPQERDSGADKGKSRDKEAVRKEVVRLRESIQKVTKSANPLGKARSSSGGLVSARLVLSYCSNV